MAKAPKSLWNSRRTRKTGHGWISGYPTIIPGTTLRAPCLHVDTIPDDADSLGECEAYASHVWALNADGYAIAERIAGDLAQFGFAWAFPHEVNHVRVDVAPMHRMHCIAPTEVNHG